MSNKDKFLIDLKKVEELNPDDIVWKKVATESGFFPTSIDVIGVDERKVNKRDGMEILLALNRSSINVIKDHPKVTEAINMLLEIVAAQESKLASLEGELERVRSERIAVTAQDQAKALTENLADKGYATGSQRFTVKVEEEASVESEEKSERNSESSRGIDVIGKIKGLAKVLAGLDVGVKVEHESIEKELRASSNSARNSKKVNLIWEIESVTPPTDPKAHAQAYRLRIGKESSPLNGQTTRWPYFVVAGILLLALLFFVLNGLTAR